MTYKQLLAAGRAMDDATVADSLKGLVADPRLAALFAVIDRIKEETADVACLQKLADSPGSLEHAAGMRCGLLTLESRLRQFTDPPKPTGRRGPPPEGEGE